MTVVSEPNAFYSVKGVICHHSFDAQTAPILENITILSWKRGTRQRFVCLVVCVPSQFVCHTRSFDKTSFKSRHEIPALLYTTRCKPFFSFSFFFGELTL